MGLTSEPFRARRNLKRRVKLCEPKTFCIGLWSRFVLAEAVRDRTLEMCVCVCKAVGELEACLRPSNSARYRPWGRVKFF